MSNSTAMLKHYCIDTGVAFSCTSDHTIVKSINAISIEKEYMINKQLTNDNVTPCEEQGCSNKELVPGIINAVSTQHRSKNSFLVTGNMK